MEHYLKSRNRDRRGETPLMYAYHDQNYIHYPKGAIVFYALSEYIGEKELNEALKKYVDKVAFQEERYTTSMELVNHIRPIVPDSLQYLIKDFFETVTLYDNQIVNWSATQLANRQYQVAIEFLVRKYRSGEKGKEIYSDNGLDSLGYTLPNKAEFVYSLPLADYIDIGVFDETGNELYLQPHQISSIENRVSIMWTSCQKK